MTYNRSMDSDPDVEYGTWSCLDCDTTWTGWSDECPGCKEEE